jgi:MYXO-CTERM domain-containing protein
MIKLTNLTLNGLMAATLLASPLFSQTDAARSTDTANTMQTNDQRDEGFDMGWLGLIGLAGLAGLRRPTTQPVMRTDD